MLSLRSRMKSTPHSRSVALAEKVFVVLVQWTSTVAITWPVFAQFPKITTNQLFPHLCSCLSLRTSWSTCPTSTHSTNLSTHSLKERKWLLTWNQRKTCRQSKSANYLTVFTNAYYAHAASQLVQATGGTHKNISGQPFWCKHTDG